MIFIMGKHAGGLSFGTFSLAIKEKVLAHKGRKTRLNPGKRIKRKPQVKDQASNAPAQIINQNNTDKNVI
ncbi:MAG: hypothetical protein BMS9Abin25_0968 [Gammaproteobacteria bacterium]|nr:MAG: hypothetical protein BMS9Abin25_0968 [Gammaproteobacteria bacterium]